MKAGVILLGLFALCNGEYPPPLPDEAPDSYGPPMDSYTPPFLSDNYDPPPSAPGDGYGPPPAGPSDSYGLPKAHSVRAKAKQSSAKSAPSRVATTTPKASNRFAFSDGFVVPSGKTFEASPAITEAIPSPSPAKHFSVNIVAIAPPSTSIPVPSVVSSVPEPVPGVFAPVRASVPVSPQYLIRTAISPDRAALSLPVQSVTPAVARVSLETNINPLTQFNAVPVGQSVPTYSDYRQYILPGLTPYGYASFYLRSDPLRSFASDFTQQEAVSTTALTNSEAQQRGFANIGAEAVPSVAASALLDAASSAIRKYESEGVAVFAHSEHAWPRIEPQ